MHCSFIHSLKTEVQRSRTVVVSTSMQLRSCHCLMNNKVIRKVQRKKIDCKRSEHYSTDSSSPSRINTIINRWLLEELTKLPNSPRFSPTIPVTYPRPIRTIEVKECVRGNNSHFSYYYASQNQGARIFQIDQYN